MRRFVASPTDGVPTTYTPRRTGQKVPARLFVEGTVLESGDPPLPGARPFGELKGRYWDPRTRSLVIKLGSHTFAVGPDVLLGLGEGTEIALHVRYIPV